MIDKRQSYAIVGASNDENKYGHKVLKDLKDAGYDVVPVNPNEKEVLGLGCFPTLADIGRKIDVAVFVVPPNVTESVIKGLPKGIRKVWLQPGAGSEKAISLCKERGVECVHDDCIMVRRREC